MTVESTPNRDRESLDYLREQMLTLRQRMAALETLRERVAALEAQLEIDTSDIPETSEEWFQKAKVLMTPRTMKPWKPHPMARTCKWCGSHRPGMQPLRLNGERGYWHLKCFEAAKKEGRGLISAPKTKTGA